MIGLASNFVVLLDFGMVLRVERETQARLVTTVLAAARQDVDGVINGGDRARAQANLGARGTSYRVQGGPVGDRQAATDLCAKLKARNVSCIIVKP